MSKTCPNCGAVNPDVSNFCMICAAPMPQEEMYRGDRVGYEAPVERPEDYGDAYQYQQEPEAPYGGYQQGGYPDSRPQPYPMTPAPKKKKSHAAAIIISVVALLLVAAAVLIVVLPLTVHVDVFGLHLFDNDPKGVTERFLKAAYVDCDAKGVADCLYETKYASGVNKVDDSGVQQLQTMLDSLKSAGYKIKYNILDEYIVDDAKYNQVIEQMQKDGTDTSGIEKMLEVDFTLEANGNTSDTMTALCIKAKGRWYVSMYSLTNTFAAM